MKEIQVVNKPAGFNSHSINPQSEGYVEYLSRIHKKKYWLCHRLDKETSGALLLSLSKENTHKVSELFAQKKILKKYLFITDRESPHSTYTVCTRIFRDGKNYVSENRNPNSETRFTLLKAYRNYYLWQANPVTGKTHQIRIHAKTAGIPILGDKLYGGSEFFRLMLHSAFMEINHNDSSICFDVPAPVYFSDLALLMDQEICLLINSVERRITLFSEDGSFLKLPSTIRLVHTEHPWLRCDKLGDVLWFSSFHTSKKIEDILPLIEKLKIFYPFTKFWLQLMDNRGKNPNTLTSASSCDLPHEWIVKENDINFLIKTNSGSSSGIFLDQRKNREWVLENSNKKKVLNLFSYTSVFSVAAAKGNAEEVVSVDTSITTLSWAKKNFELNNLNPEKYEFWASDSETFLEGCVRKKRQFDLIICDPPSFSRSKKSVFKIEKAFEKILKLCHLSLKDNGMLLFSSNFEKWERKEFEKKIPADLYSQVDHPATDYDFEFPAQKTILKVFYLKKINLSAP